MTEEEIAEALRRHDPSTDTSQPRLPEWTIDSPCTVVDPKLFHPEPDASTLPAREVCARCPVREKCLRDNLADPYGIVGGLTPAERLTLLAITPIQAQRPPHGARSRYIGSTRWHGCTCPACRAAHSENERRRRERVRAKRGADVSESAYKNTVDPSRLARFDTSPVFVARVEFDSSATLGAVTANASITTKQARGIPSTPGAATSVWQGMVIVESKDRAPAESAALEVAVWLEREGLRGWRLYDAEGTLIDEAVGPHVGAARYGDVAWWSENDMPMPGGEPWTFEQAERLRIAALSAESRPCMNGHVRSPATTYTETDGRVRCLPCRRERQRRYSARQRTLTRAA